MIVLASDEEQAWTLLRAELLAFVRSQRASGSRAAAERALQGNSPRGAWRALDDIATAQASTPDWLYECQHRIRPLLKLDQ